MNAPAFFEIQASDPVKLMRFYREIFGWRFTEQAGAPVPYWQIETDGIRGGLLKRVAPIPSAAGGTNAFTCSMQVASFDQVAKAILANGGMTARPKFAVPGKCWQGYFVDPDGNTFGLFEVDEHAS
jgi:predicted enzyme related to lactoylglutathione lyase